MLKIKDDVPLINLIDMDFTCEPFDLYVSDRHTLKYVRFYNDKEVFILSDDRIIKCHNLYEFGFSTLKMYDHCIRDLVQKGYVEDVKN